MKLNVAERLHLLSIIPKEGNFLTLKIVKELQDNLGFSEKEFKTLEIQQTETGAAWNKKGKEATEIEMGKKAKELIVESLEKLDEKGELSIEHFSICEKFLK